MRRIVFVAAVLRRIVRRRDDDAVGEAIRSALVVAQDRVRDHRGRRIAAAIVDHDLDAVGGKHLDGAGQRRLGQRVGIDADEQRAGQAAGAAVIADRLRRGQDMVFVEGIPERRAAVARGAEGHALQRIGRVGLVGEIGRHQSRNIDERSGIDRFACGGIGGSHMTSRERECLGSPIVYAKRQEPRPDRAGRITTPRSARSQNIENNPMHSSRRPAWRLRKQVDTSGKSGAFLHHPAIL